MLTAIDLFAGMGGNTIGAEMAGVRTVWAANHNRMAVDYHARNHPDVEHACQDLHLADWNTVPDHDILISSPCCQGHSRAKGKTKDWSETSRSTAWCIFSCAARHRPKAIIVENVPEFSSWSESDDPQDRGSTYLAWRSLIERIGIGYNYSDIVLDAADLGVPQHRRRLFMTFVRKDFRRGPIPLPQPAKPHSPFSAVMEGGDGLSWSRVSGKAASTQSFIERSATRFAGRGFLIPYFSTTLKTGYGRSLERPIGSLTTKARYGVVDPSHRWLRMLTVEECRRVMGFPEGYALPSVQKDAIHLLGNAVVPGATAHILRGVAETIQPDYYRRKSA